MPEISVIVPVYKVEKYIRKCVDSILNQTMDDIEIILVDDGSPDNCSEIIDQIKESDERIVVIHQENRGLGGARNTGIAKSRGKYIAFVDSDDWVSADFCESMYKKAKETQADLVLIGETLFHDESKEFCRGWRDFSRKNDTIEILNKSNFIECFTPAWGRLYRKDYLILNNFKFIEKCFYEDNSWGCFFILKGAKVAFAGNKYFYRQRFGSITANKEKNASDFLRDCEYFHQSIANIKYNEKNLKLCRIFYLINFYNYYLSLSIDLRVDFFKRMKCITNNWNITFEDLKISREDSDKIINIYEFYSGLPFETKFVRLFSVIPLISVKKYSKKFGLIFFL